MRRRRSKSDMITGPAATLRKVGMPLALLSGLLVASPATSQSDEEAAGPAPLLVVFGPAAPQSEGDHDWRQFIRFSVPEDAGRFFRARVRSGRWRRPMTSSCAALERRPDLPFMAPMRPRRSFAIPTVQFRKAVEGRSLETVTYGESPAADGRWNTLFAADAAQGRAVEGRREFVLAVEGVEGADGNRIRSCGHHTGRQQSAAGGDCASIPTCRPFRWPRRVNSPNCVSTFPKKPRHWQSKTSIPPVVGSTMMVSSGLSRLPASGKSEWVRAVVPLEAEERGRIGSVTVAEGGETPNDVTVFVGYPNGGDDTIEHPIAIDLPVRAFNRNRRPLIDINVSQTALPRDAIRCIAVV